MRSKRLWTTSPKLPIKPHQMGPSLYSGRFLSHGFRSLSERLLIEHDGRGEAQQFALLPEPWVDAIGPQPRV